ncbi:phosphatase PAP2 family protein [Lactococcus hodotermopsidis]|uniref:Phosphatase PAP2 family protein n=2 Tax=Pseudolactococcus hodotermopsidis TaxID=2709157 RepID=A0A6A0BEP2_9LACT|nr:phosphatase PAP2 family protein [Lactococcus hodotermopsidis]
MYQLGASFGLILFVILGYVVKFYPHVLSGFDDKVQGAIRCEMLEALTVFFKFVTHFAGFVYVPVILVVFTAFFLIKKWYAELIFLVGNVAVMPVLVHILKGIYGRSRPSVVHLVVEYGFSFPSGHAATGLMVYGCLMVLICQRLHSSSIKWLIRVLLTIFIVLIGISRVYLGVHYPSDILGGWLLSGSLLLLGYPIYDEWRFKWRFKGVQK